MRGKFYKLKLFQIAVYLLDRCIPFRSVYFIFWRMLVMCVTVTE